MNTLLKEYLNKKGFTPQQLFAFNAVICDGDKIVTGQPEPWLETVVCDKTEEYPDAKAIDIIKYKINKYKSDGCDCAIFVPLFRLNGEFTGFSIRRMDPVNKHDSWFVPGSRKIDLLYNLNRAFDYAIKKNSLIITEGVYDTIALVNHGFKNAVALLGTNLSNLQYFQLLSTVENVALCLDNDQAGISAMEKIVKTHPNELKYYRVDIDKDPDEFLAEHTPEEFKKRIVKFETGK
jgi:DNA primase